MSDNRSLSVPMGVKLFKLYVFKNVIDVPKYFSCNSMTASIDIKFKNARFIFKNLVLLVLANI